MLRRNVVDGTVIHRRCRKQEECVIRIAKRHVLVTDQLLVIFCAKQNISKEDSTVDDGFL